MNLIIVDNNKIFRESLQFYLEQVLSHVVISVAINGEDFLNNSPINKADIILMDIEMPKMNGIEATKKALNNNSDLKIMAVTNYSYKAYLEELKGAGFKACVFKNNLYEELEKALIMLFNNQQYWSDNFIIRKNK